MTGHCWNCGRLQIVCNFRHFIKDFVCPALIGAVIGAPIGACLAMLQNWYGTWS